MQLCAKTPPFSGYMGGDKEGGNEPYLQETDLTLKYGSSWPLGQVKNRVIGELNKMARKPGPVNPDGASGNARLGVGRGSNAGRSQKSSVNAKEIQAKTKATLSYPDNYKARFAQIDRMFSNMGSVRPSSAPLPKSPRVVKPQPAAGSVAQVKLTAQQFGQKLKGREARAISALLRGRVK